ncbi:hypothetical protein J6590_014909 [Homalodisca vitripennis]|nr:hypothetical protein J6590_014909 [Homalodisca vitripennis]
MGSGTEHIPETDAFEPLPNIGTHASNTATTEVRHKLRRFFCGDGQVPWQDAVISRADKTTGKVPAGRPTGQLYNTVRAPDANRSTAVDHTTHKLTRNRMKTEEARQAMYSSCLGNLDRIASRITDPRETGSSSGGFIRVPFGLESVFHGCTEKGGDAGDGMGARELMIIETSKERPERK